MSLDTQSSSALLSSKPALKVRSSRWILPLLPWLTLAVLTLLWQAGVRLLEVPIFILPAPSDIFASIVKWWPVLMDHGLYTLVNTLAGFGLAVVFGILLGVLIGSSEWVYRALYPLLIGFNSIPKAALVPILVIWFGIGTVPAILSAFLISFFPIVVNMSTGLASVEPELMDVLRALRARPLEILTKVRLPRAMPYFFASLKVAITLAFVGAVVSELAASNKGVGYLMSSASSNLDVPLVFAGLTVLAVMGVLLYAALALLEWRFVRWAYRN